MNILETLQTFIRLEGMTQKELAAKAGMSPSALNKILLGKQAPTWDEVMTIIKVLYESNTSNEPNKKEAHTFIYRSFVNLSICSELGIPMKTFN